MRTPRADRLGREVLPVRLPVLARGVTEACFRGPPGQQHPAFLECLPDRGPNQRLGARSRQADGGGELTGGRAGQAVAAFRVTVVDTATGEDVSAGAKAIERWRRSMKTSAPETGPAAAGRGTGRTSMTVAASRAAPG